MARSLDARAGEPVTGRKRGLYYGWIMVALCSTLLAFSYGARYTFGVFMDPFAREFGWSRSTMSLAFSIFTWLYGVMQIYWGILIERRHPRVVMGLGVIFFGVAVVAMAGMSTLWQLFVLQGVVAAIGFSGMGMVPSSAVVSRWFVRRKGTALSIAFAGVSVGQLVFSPLAMVWILQYGWRISLLIIGGTFVVPGILVVLLARSSPSEMG
ncbi:MAG: MFS transporter, partial [Firmicutes bacterium]|nr:MFS transporter [Bacillota bacterium]